MIPLRAVTVAGNPALEAAIAERLGLHDSFELVLRCVDRVELLGAIRGARLDVVVSVGLPQWVDLQAVEEARARGLRIVVVGDAMVDGARVKRLGLRQVVAHEPEAILDVLESVEEPAPSEILDERPSGRLVAVWGPKGAPGRTSIAFELAAHIAETEPSTLLVDADPYGGDLLQLAGIVEELPTIVWAARMAAKDELDESSLRAELRRVGARGPALLPGIPRPELWPEISDFGWGRLLAEARAAFAYTICDTGFCFEPDPSPYPEAGEGRNRVARLTLSEADRVVAVCRADPVGIKQFAWAMDALGGLVDMDRVAVVANRVRSGKAREIEDLLRKHVGKRPAALVPERVTDWHRAVAAGKAMHELRPGSETSDALRPLVASLGARVPTRGLLTRLAGKR